MADKNVNVSVPEFVVRLLAEKKELKDRVEKLDDFINDSDRFSKVEKDHQELLLKQRKCMKEYLSILKKRCKMLLNSKK